MKEIQKQNELMPLIAIRGIVCFPNMVINLPVEKDRNIRAIKSAVDNDRKLFLVAQKDVFGESSSINNLYRCGVVVEVRQMLTAPDGIIRILVEGLYKANLCTASFDEDFSRCEVKQVKHYNKTYCDETEMSAVVRSLHDIFERYVSLLPKAAPEELVESVICQNNPIKLFESIVFNIQLEYTCKQLLLEEDDIYVRLSELYAILVKETEVLEIEYNLSRQVAENLDRRQHEVYLREKMNVISHQLGEDDASRDEYEYMTKINNLGANEEITEKLTKEVYKLTKMPPASQEAGLVKSYLDICVSLPFSKSSKIKSDIKKADKILEKDHYGLKKVKERILESIAVHALNPEAQGQIICLVGPPGVGKTSIGRSVAKALGREYVRVSLGGIRDEADIRGHRKTYIGAMPGRIINAIIKAGKNNPLILFDEIDKMSNDYKGDPSSAMLEVLDPEQNKEFRDHYIEFPFDLSKAFFITTANTTSTIPEPLLDRMDIIEITSYTREEKFNIAKRHLLSKQLKKHGLRANQMKISDDALYKLIDAYTKEAGVRSLERQISSLCRKTAKEIVSGNMKRVSFTSDNIKDFLGIEKYAQDKKADKDEIGIVNGLAWTSVGGVLMPLEVLIMDGKGNIEITGSLGDVMKESAKIAVSYSRSVAEKYGINPDFYSKNDIHIHAPEGAVPKDGPSAGVTMVTAMISALSGIPVKSDVAMTGEITLHGKVMAIGGLREKSMAAYKAGIKNVIIPYDNRHDLEEIDDTVKMNVNFILAKNLSDVLSNALAMPVENAKICDIQTTESPVYAFDV